uniref:Uncharacterized protein n=1 Tax=Anguilla anguilla TaxID=7936 RepID=A0A0E9TJA3_ANGAN
MSLCVTKLLLQSRLCHKAWFKKNPFAHKHTCGNTYMVSSVYVSCHGHMW